MSIQYYNKNNYIELENIIPINQWILYDDYIKVWSQIWKFIERKRRTHSVYINNFAYNSPNFGGLNPFLVLIVPLLFIV